MSQGQDRADGVKAIMRSLRLSRTLRPVLLAATFTAAVLTGCLPESAPATQPVPTPEVLGEACGVERWTVKTLSDADAANVTVQPQETTVTALRKLPAPADLPSKARIAPTELTTFEVQATVKEFKLETDSDIHVVITTPGRSTETMIVELPSPDCISQNALQIQTMTRARSDFEAICGKPSTSWKRCSAQLVIDGVGFFDFKHGQTGAAPNAIELHPVLSVRRP